MGEEKMTTDAGIKNWFFYWMEMKATNKYYMAEISRQLGYVPQYAVLYCTIAENKGVNLGLYPSLEEAMHAISKLDNAHRSWRFVGEIRTSSIVQEKNIASSRKKRPLKIVSDPEVIRLVNELRKATHNLSLRLDEIYGKGRGKTPKSVYQQI